MASEWYARSRHSVISRNCVVLVAPDNQARRIPTC